MFLPLIHYQIAVTIHECQLFNFLAKPRVNSRGEDDEWFFHMYILNCCGQRSQR